MANFMPLQALYKAFNHSLEPDQPAVGHFNIFKVEELLLPEHKPVSYSRRDFYKISIVNGHSKIYYADRCYEVKEHALVFTNPMTPYFWERISRKHSGYVCVFTEAFFNRFEDIRQFPAFQFAGNSVISLTNEEADMYYEIFEKMFNELQSSYAHKYDLLRHLLMEVVHLAQKIRPEEGILPTGPKAAERIAGLFAELLERQFPIEISKQTIKIKSPSGFASRLNIHVNHLNKVLKEISGKTTSQLINERLLQEAKILLKSTDWTINEIAWCLGFEEPNHFSTFFRSRAGLTANQFRRTGN